MDHRCLLRTVPAPGSGWARFAHQVKVEGSSQHPTGYPGVCSGLRVGLKCPLDGKRHFPSKITGVKGRTGITPTVTVTEGFGGEGP